VQLLIEHGAEVHAEDDTHSTPLHLASALPWGNLRTVQLLIQHGADVNTQDGNRSTLHLASSKGKLEIVQLLIKHGADVNAEDGTHSIPLHLATSHQEPVADVVRVLLARAWRKCRCRGR